MGWDGMLVCRFFVRISRTKERKNERSASFPSWHVDVKIRPLLSYLVVLYIGQEQRRNPRQAGRQAGRQAPFKWDWLVKGIVQGEGVLFKGFCGELWMTDTLDS